jgi:hypothetical protein
LFHKKVQRSRKEVQPEVAPSHKKKKVCSI